ncbi:hypothetical protein C8J57DRAFT_1220908 [Mycena rebaudengoi]|nr:hypothetical protein C8J57DRAFT_1220908 [Mycena rebaudengoi]
MFGCGVYDITPVLKARQWHHNIISELNSLALHLTKLFLSSSMNLKMANATLNSSHSDFEPFSIHLVVLPAFQPWNPIGAPLAFVIFVPDVAVLQVLVGQIHGPQLVHIYSTGSQQLVVDYVAFWAWSL